MADNHKLSLDGDWDFQLKPVHNADATPTEEWRRIMVPSPWQAQFDDLRSSSGTAVYRRRFTIHDLPMDGAAVLQHAAGYILLHRADVLHGAQKIGEFLVNVEITRVHLGRDPDLVYRLRILTKHSKRSAA